MQNPAANKPDSPAILKTVADLRSFVARQREDNHDIAMVPTMGALHEGHLSLVREGFQEAGCVIVSIFVNPTQFAPHEDLESYPPTWEEDLENLSALGVQGIFYPSANEMYPQGFETTVSVNGVSEPLEGEKRPGHFDGVATIVSKLLLQCQPDIALFGEKDWQQLQVIKRMAADLNLPVNIRGVPTMRDDNGLARYSRNTYLSQEQYQTATSLNKVLFAMSDKINAGDSYQDVQTWGIKALEKAGFDSVDYLEVRDAQTLEEPSDKPLRILAAVHLGGTRLIDNVAVL